MSKADPIFRCKRCKKKVSFWLMYWADKDGWLICGKKGLPHKPKECKK